MPQPDAPAAATDFLAALAAALDAEAPAARDLLAGLGPGGGRDAWLSWAPLAGAEPTLAVAALLGGWAVLREPGDAPHPATFAWARPTIASGDPAALAALAAGLEGLAPRWRRARWLAKRLGRLRAWIVTGGSLGTDLAARLVALAPAARIFPLPDA